MEGKIFSRMLSSDGIRAYRYGNVISVAKYESLARVRAMHQEACDCNF